MPKKKYNIGEKVYSPFRKPSGSIPEKARWIPISFHHEKGYPITWMLIDGEGDPVGIEGLPSTGAEGEFLIRGVGVEGKRFIEPTFVSEVAKALEKKEG